MKQLLIVLALTLSASLASAQPGTFSTYGNVCSGASALAVTGVPKIGTTFTVSGIAFPNFCTRKFCGCNVGKCNDCGGSVLFVGASKVNAPLPGGCVLLNSADILLFGQGPKGTVTFPVPNNAALFGVQVHMQRIDLAIDEMITASCGTAYVPKAFTGTSEGVTATVGL